MEATRTSLRLVTGLGLLAGTYGAGHYGDRTYGGVPGESVPLYRSSAVLLSLATLQAHGYAGTP